ncbi:nitrous oxide-stimulated promoter family protein [Vibrio algivorus]|uniref:Nitrous oxide-stimulated promoter family protein n=1 Tax=Vibrio algivorus TaxID=1667024 RepID=A0ABQ6EMQ9_9VIBR|nr:nitrous oxide-stimulated promoter family protein [Vibrio algivorus]GLT14135.1 hypothetical protein GCM10007931_11090 [Vibrio algivorus]
MQDDILQGALRTEMRTVTAMVEIYCRAHHHADGSLCQKCCDLIDYARMRLDRCPYGEGKPTCNKCPIHCYKPEQKEKMRLVMRYSGPRMLLPHPLLAIRHLYKERKKAVGKPAANQSNRSKRLQK